MIQAVSRALCVAALCAFAAYAAHAQVDVPFRTRNLSPLITIFGLPSWRATADSFEVSLTSELANHYRFSQRGTETLVLDGETWRNSLSISKPLGTDWSFTAEVPYYLQFGGILDNVVDAWHSVFNLPDGGRNNHAEGDLFFEMGNANGVFYEHSRRASALGDVQLGLWHRFGRDGTFHIAGVLKLPTGDEDILAGSGSTDFALSLLRTRSAMLRRRSAGYFWGLGLFSLGKAERIEFTQKHDGYMAVVGGSLALNERLGLKVQIDTHRALYDSELEEIGEDAFQATVGGWWRFGEHGIMDFGVNEDLEVSTSPDVVIIMNLRWSW